MNPNFIAKKSAWAAVKPLRVLFFFLVIPLLVMIFDIIRIKKEEILFFDDKVVHKRGWLTTKEAEYAFGGVYSVSICQGIFGTMFGYGDLAVDAVGHWGDLSLDHVKDPQKAKAFLAKHMVKRKAMHPIVTG